MFSKLGLHSYSLNPNGAESKVELPSQYVVDPAICTNGLNATVNINSSVEVHPLLSVTVTS